MKLNITEVIMAITTKSKFIIVLLLGCSSLFAQEFNIENELTKQRKKHPQITVYQASYDNVICCNNVVYREEGERQITSDIFLPKDTVGKSYPLVIFIHGGGWRSGNKTMDHPMALSVTPHGYVTMCVDYRKSTEALYPAAIIDIKCAIRWARANANKYHINTQEITLIGTSAGGQMAALIGSENGTMSKYKNNEFSEYSDLVQRVIDIDGVLAFIHPDSSEGNDKPGKPSAATLWFGCNTDSCTNLFNEASALHHVGEQSADFIFINSSQKRFSAGQREMMDALHKYGHNATEYKTEGTPHTFWLFNPWAEQVIDWIITSLSTKK